MVKSRVFLVGVAFVAVALAGCVTGDDEGSNAGATGPEGVESDELGRIVGLVVDDSLTPVAGVQVAILNSEFETTSAQDGSFELAGLEPGTYQVFAQKLGFDSAAKRVDVLAGQAVEVQFALVPVPVSVAARQVYLVGDGYFACGAYILGVLTWGNLHACVWDEHRPRFTFEADRANFMGILQEIVWEQSTALTAEKLLTSIQYKPVCDPFCQNEESWAGQNSPSPVRAYIDDFEDWAPDADEDPIPLASMTFPGGDGQELVIVFQQRMTHYITLYYGEHGSLDDTQIPDA